MPIRAVIFDLDGTLLDTLADIAFAMNRALADGSFPTHPVEAYRTMVGNGIEVLVRKALPESALNPTTIHDMIMGMKHHYEAHQYDQTQPYEQIPELLGALLERDVRLAVLSNKPHPFTLAAVHHFFPDVPFQPIWGALPEERPLKPEPGPLLDQIQAMGVAKAEVLYVGDTRTDMETATAADVTGVGVTWGFRNPEELRRFGADHIVAEPLQILDLL